MSEQSNDQTSQPANDQTTEAVDADSYAGEVEPGDSTQTGGNLSESGTATYDPTPSAQILKDPVAGTDEAVNQPEGRVPGDYGTTDDLTGTDPAQTQTQAQTDQPVAEQDNAADNPPAQ